MAIANRSKAGLSVAGADPAPVTVYTLPFCARSIATLRDLARFGVDFTEVDLSADPSARAHVEALGYMRAPVVETGPANWAGYHPERIAALAAGMAKASAIDFSVIRPDAMLTRS